MSSCRPLETFKKHFEDIRNVTVTSKLQTLKSKSSKDIPGINYLFYLLFYSGTFFFLFYVTISFNELGKGRFGVVHLVREVGSQKCFAAKFIKTRRRSYRELAHQEISILQGLSHENIIQYVDSYSDPASIVIVMEYLDGGELFVKIADEDFILTETDCVMFVSQICLGVQYLHSLSIVHLDLKVSNCVDCKQE